MLTAANRDETVDDVPVSFRIKTRRNERGLLQRDLAEAIGVGTRTIIRWENGDDSPIERHRARLAEILGGRPDEYAVGVEKSDGSTELRRVKERLRKVERELAELRRALAGALDRD